MNKNTQVIEYFVKMGEIAYNRLYLNDILKRLKEPRRFIQIISGPRQAGKTTLMQQAIERCDMAIDYYLADEPNIRDRVWIEQNRENGRLTARERGRKRENATIRRISELVNGLIWGERVIVKRSYQACNPKPSDNHEASTAPRPSCKPSCCRDQNVACRPLTSGNRQPNYFPCFPQPG